MSRAPKPPGSPTTPAQRARRAALWLVAVALVALVADGLYVAWRLNASLDDARVSLDAGRDELSDGRVRAASAAFDDALDAAQGAESLTRHPAYALAGVLPPSSRDADAVRALASAATLSARAGVAATDGAAEIGGAGGGLAASLYRAGRVDFDAIATLRPFVHDAAALLERAEDVVAGSPAPRLGLVRDARAAAARRLDDALGTARRGTVLLDALPGLLGDDTTRRYLLAFQTPSEARGGGGFIGMYGILEAYDGRLRLARVSSIRNLVRLGPAKGIDAPQWFRRTWGPSSSLRDPRQVNYSPNFPVTSEVLLDMYDQLAGETLDGVVAMDPVALTRLTAAIGPVSSPGFDVEVGPDNGDEVLMRDIYVDFDDNRTQHRFLAGLVRDFWTRLGSGGVDAPELARALADAVRGQHFKVYARDDGGRAALAELDADGDYEAAGAQVQMVFQNSALPNKVDYFMFRRIETDVTLAADGAADVVTTVTLKNNAPTGPPSVLLGRTPGLVGLDRAFVYFLLPKGARGGRLEIEGRRRYALPGRDDEHPLRFGLVHVPPGEEREVRLAYRVPPASPDARRFELTLFPQATVHVDQFRLTIAPPEGFGLEVAGDAGSVTARGYELSGVLDEPKTAAVELTRAP